MRQEPRRPSPERGCESRGLLFKSGIGGERQEDGEGEMDRARFGVVEHAEAEHEGQRRGDPELEQGPGERHRKQQLGEQVLSGFEHRYRPGQRVRRDLRLCHLPFRRLAHRLPLHKGAAFTVDLFGTWPDGLRRSSKPQVVCLDQFSSYHLRLEAAAQTAPPLPAQVKLEGAAFRASLVLCSSARRPDAAGR